ncbi:MAG TPA: hypothetical protein VMM13_04685 [Euzebya sp.]|nr:hypothetical protein [Euzebya sp.]
MRAIRVLLLRLVLLVPLLHRTVSRRFLLLTALDGRALSPTVPIRYAVHDSDLIAVGRRDGSWWRGLSAERAVPATMRLKGTVLPLTATLAAGEALDEAVLRYLQKYPGEWKALGVDPGAGPEEVQAAAQGSAVVLFHPA